LGALLLDSFIKFFLATAILTFNCSVEYISLKALCRYQDPDVPECIQKKIYGVLAPLFSQKPWNSEYNEPKIDDYSYSQVQAAFYILIPANFPKELQRKIFNKVSFSMRQYKSFRSQASFVPFLYEDRVWALQSERCQIKRHVGYQSYWNGVEWVPFVSSDILALFGFKGFNYRAYPTAVLKMKEKGIIACLFLYGGISIADLKTMKETWNRKWQRDDDSIVYHDDCGVLMTGYNDIICFLDQSKNRFKLYTVFDLMNQKECSYQIQNKIDNNKFDMIHTKFLGSLTAMNSNYFFYAFFLKKHVDPGSHSYFGCSPVNKILTQLYYVAYKDTSNEEKIFYTLEDSELFFKHLTCNDTCLIAKDNKERIYVWNLLQEPCLLSQIIECSESMLPRDFWLDSDSETILTQKGTFKIQNVFADLPTLPSIVVIKPVIKTLPPSVIKPILEEKTPILESAFPFKYSFFKGLCLRVYWFILSWYWVIKSLLKKHSIS
jgi:hypothetical protein